MINQEQLRGYAFPLIKVRYRGPTDAHGSRWSASVAGMRTTLPYASAKPGGSAGALPAARKMWGRALAEQAGTGETPDDFIFIPIDISNDTYGFVPISKIILWGSWL
jgi:hypothetical protein